MAAGSPRSPAEPRGGGGVPLVAGATLPLAFIAAGLFALAAATAWLAVEPGLLRGPPGQPRAVALAHLWLPDFLLSACCGAVYQLMPVVLGTALRAPLALAWTHFVLHSTGNCALVLGLARGNLLLAATGGTAVAVGTGVLAATTGRTFAAARRRDAIAWRPCSRPEPASCSHRGDARGWP